MSYKVDSNENLMPGNTVRNLNFPIVLTITTLLYYGCIAVTVLTGLSRDIGIYLGFFFISLFLCILNSYIFFRYSSFAKTEGMLSPEEFEKLVNNTEEVKPAIDTWKSRCWFALFCINTHTRENLFIFNRYKLRKTAHNQGTLLENPTESLYRCVSTINLSDRSRQLFEIRKQDSFKTFTLCKYFGCCCSSGLFHSNDIISQEGSNAIITKGHRIDEEFYFKVGVAKPTEGCSLECCCRMTFYIIFLMIAGILLFCLSLWIFWDIYCWNKIRTYKSIYLEYDCEYENLEDCKLICTERSSLTVDSGNVVTTFTDNKKIETV